MNETRNNMFAKLLNKSITGRDFVDKPLNNYIYASLTQPPIKIVDKNNSDDEMDYIVECPNCGTHVVYGEDVFMRSGHIYCSTKGCLEKLEYLYFGGHDEKEQ